MKKSILLTLLFATLVSNFSFSKIGSIGLQKIRNSVVDALKNSQKLDHNSFKQFVQNSKEKKETNPKNQLANIINVSEGSTVKGLPTYTSKIEKEINEQIEYSEYLINDFIKLANQFTLVELMENEERKNSSIDAFSMLKDLIIQNYKNEEEMFTNFATDLREEQQNLEKQIKILNNLKDATEVKENNQIKERLESTLSKLYSLKNNICKFIEKVNFLIGNSLKLLSTWLILSHTKQKNDLIGSIVDSVTENLMDNASDAKSVDTNTKEIALRSIDELVRSNDAPEIITTLPEIKDTTPPIESGDYLIFRPFHA